MATMTPVHFSQVRPEQWPWPHFSPAEMASRDDGTLLISADLMDKLEALRAEMGGKPLIVTSGYRSPAHNARVGGAKNSYHLKGMAADILTQNIDPQALEATARKVGFTGIIRYPDRGFIHLDVRPGSLDQGKPFPPRDNRFDDSAPAIERPPIGAPHAPQTAGVFALLSWFLAQFGVSDKDVQFIQMAAQKISDLSPVAGQIVRGAVSPFGIAVLVGALVYAWRQGWFDRFFRRGSDL